MRFSTESTAARLRISRRQCGLDCTARVAAAEAGPTGLIWRRGDGETRAAPLGKRKLRPQRSSFEIDRIEHRLRRCAFAADRENLHRVEHCKKTPPKQNLPRLLQRQETGSSSWRLLRIGLRAPPRRLSLAALWRQVRRCPTPELHRIARLTLLRIRLVAGIKVKPKSSRSAKRRCERLGHCFGQGNSAAQKGLEVGRIEPQSVTDGLPRGQAIFYGILDQSSGRYGPIAVKIAHHFVVVPQLSDRTPR